MKIIALAFFVNFSFIPLEAAASFNDHSCPAGYVVGVRTDTNNNWAVYISLNDMHSWEVEASKNLRMNTPAGKAAYASIIAAKNSHKTVQLYSNSTSCAKFESVAWGDVADR